MLPWLEVDIPAPHELVEVVIADSASCVGAFATVRHPDATWTFAHRIVSPQFDHRHILHVPARDMPWVRREVLSAMAEVGVTITLLDARQGPTALLALARGE